MTSDERYLAAAATARDAVEKSVEMWKQSAQMLSEQAVLLSQLQRRVRLWCGVSRPLRLSASTLV